MDQIYNFFFPFIEYLYERFPIFKETMQVIYTIVYLFKKKPRGSNLLALLLYSCLSSLMTFQAKFFLPNWYLAPQNASGLTFALSFSSLILSCPMPNLLTTSFMSFLFQLLFFSFLENTFYLSSTILILFVFYRSLLFSGTYCSFTLCSLSTNSNT